MFAVSMKPFFEAYKNKCTSRAFGNTSSRLKNPTIDAVVSGASTKTSPALAWVKGGHVGGATSLGFGAAFTWLYKKFDNRFLKFIFGGIATVDFIGGAASILTATFGKNAEEVKSLELLDKYLDKSQQKSHDLSSVVLHSDHKRALATVVEDARKQGVVVNIFGPIGTGKTMTCQAMVNELVTQGVCKKAVFWYAKKGFLDASMKDAIEGADLGILKSFIKADGETIDQKIERLIANALAHYKETGEYVVLCLDEADKLLDGGGNAFLEMLGIQDYASEFRSSINPKDRPKLIQAYAKLIDRLKQPDCKGVVLMQASNSGGNKYDFLGRRVTNLYIDRPNQLQREAILRQYFEEYKKEMGFNIALSDDQYKALSEIGDVNMYESIFGSRSKYGITSDASDYDDSYVGDHGFKAAAKKDKAKLENFPILPASLFAEKIVKDIATACKNGEFKTADQVFGELHIKLTQATETLGKDTSKIEEEYKLRNYGPIPDPVPLM